MGKSIQCRRAANTASQGGIGQESVGNLREL